MGCCTSRIEDEAPPEGAHPAGTLAPQHTSSTRAIAQSAAPPSTSIQTRNRSLRPQPSLTTTTSSPRQSAAHDRERSLAEQLNAPLRAHPPWKSKKRVWTPSQLSRERYEFFETRVTNNPGIWAAIRTAVDLMREGQLATAQEILTAAGVTIPTGDLVEGAYDEMGNLYRIPAEVLDDPINVVKDGTENQDPPETMNAVTLGIEGKEIGDLGNKDEADVEVRREEKGKGNERDTVKVKCRLSDRGGPDVVISLGKSQNVEILSRRVASQAGISRAFRIRIAYLGRILNEKETLASQGWKEGQVINALVASNPAESGRGSIDAAARGGGGG